MFNFVFYAWSTVLVVGALPIALVSGAAMRRVSWFWGWTCLAMLRVLVGLRHRIRGREHVPAGPVIAAVKHQSAWDILVVSLLLPNAIIVAKRELSWIPVFGYELRRAGHIFIDRGGGAKELKRLVDRAQARVAAGHSVVVFPQGTRTLPGTPYPYQPGIAALYVALGLPVVPVALNSGLFWPRRRPLQRPGMVTVEFLPPIPPGHRRRRFMTELEDAIETATARLEAEARAEHDLG